MAPGTLRHTRHDEIHAATLPVNEVPFPEDDAQTSLCLTLHANEPLHWPLCLV